MTVLLVALGAAIGAPVRYLAGRAVSKRLGPGFPWGTLAVNVAGSALLGFLAALPAGPFWSAFAGIGFCGALTTYSTFGHETLRLAEEGARPSALLYAIGSVLAAMAAAYSGVFVARAL